MRPRSRGHARFAMLIVCPSCASEYAINPAQIGADGCRVRCAVCHAAWFAEPAAAGPERPRKPARLGAQRRRAGRLPVPGRGLAAGAALTLCCLALGAAAAGRARIVEAFPATAPYYAAAGLSVNPRGLDIRGVTSQVATKTGEGAFLMVEGEIGNVAGRMVAIPPIELAVRGSAGQALYTWTSEPPRRTLEAQASTRFRARLAAPPEEGRQVLVRFASTGGSVAGGAP